MVTGLLQINRSSKMLLLLSTNTKIISALRRIRFLLCRVIYLVLLTRFPYLGRKLPFCLHSVANYDVHRASNARTTKVFIHIQTGKVSQWKRSKQGAKTTLPMTRELLNLCSRPQMCRYFVLSDPDVTVNFYSTSQF